MSFTCNTSKWNGTKPAGFNSNQYCSRLPYYIPELIDIRAGFRDSIDPMIQAQMGLCGTHVYLGALGSSTANYCMIQIIEDTVLNVAAGNTNEKDGAGADISLAALSGKTLPKGMIINGNFVKVVLVSGTVKCYAHPFL